MPEAGSIPALCGSIVSREWFCFRPAAPSPFEPLPIARSGAAESLLPTSGSRIRRLRGGNPSGPFPYCLASPLPVNGSGWYNCRPGAGLESRRHWLVLAFYSSQLPFATTVALVRDVANKANGQFRGHENIRTAKIYTLVTHSYLRDALERPAWRQDEVSGARFCSVGLVLSSIYRQLRGGSVARWPK